MAFVTMMMESFREFSVHYAAAVSAVASLGALLLALGTLLFLMREHVNKYRPYVVPGVFVEPFSDGMGFGVSVVPRNVGPHPCEFQLRDIHLLVGDETYHTPDFREWMLLAQGVEVRVPVGHVLNIGVQRVREARYKSNRIEVRFTISTRSADRRFKKSEAVINEISVQGEVPVVHFRPEWRKDA